MREKIYGIEVESYGLTEDIYGQKQTKKSKVSKKKAMVLTKKSMVSKQKAMVLKKKSMVSNQKAMVSKKILWLQDHLSLGSTSYLLSSEPKFGCFLQAKLAARKVSSKPSLPQPTRRKQLSILSSSTKKCILHDVRYKQLHSQRHFPQGKLLKGNFPSGNFPNMQFPQGQLFKSVPAKALAAP